MLWNSDSRGRGGVLRGYHSDTGGASGAPNTGGGGDWGKAGEERGRLTVGNIY